MCLQCAYLPAPPPRPFPTTARAPALELTAEGEENKILPLVAQVKTLSGSTKTQGTLWSHFTGLKFHCLAEFMFILWGRMGTWHCLSAGPGTPGWSRARSPRSPHSHCHLARAAGGGASVLPGDRRVVSSSHCYLRAEASQLFLNPELWVFLPPQLLRLLRLFGGWGRMLLVTGPWPHHEPLPFRLF